MGGGGGGGGRRCPYFYDLAPCFAKEIATEQCSNDKISGEIHLPTSCNNL